MLTIAPSTDPYDSYIYIFIGLLHFIWLMWGYYTPTSQTELHFTMHTVHIHYILLSYDFTTLFVVISFVEFDHD